MFRQGPQYRSSAVERRWLLIVLVATTLVVLGGASLLAWVCRFQIEAAYICSRIVRSSTSDEINRWLTRLFRESGRKIRLSTAVDLIARGDSKLDYAILEFTGWPHHHPPHPLNLSQEKAEQFDRQLNDFFEAVVNVAGRRPELVDLFLHRFRYRAGANEEAAEPVDFNMIAILQSFIVPPEDIPDEESDASKAIALLVACRLTGNEHLITSMTLDNWKEISKAWEEWMLKNGKFLRFDRGRSRVVVDRAAKHMNRAVEYTAYWVTHVATPVPNWNPPKSLRSIKRSWEVLAQDQTWRRQSHQTHMRSLPFARLRLTFSAMLRPREL